jgi:hypothetical protein
MKTKTIIAILLLFSIASYSQNVDQKKHLNSYVSASLSMSGGDNFKLNSYPSLEVGAFATDNLSFGLNIGRLNLDKSPYSCEKLDNYYYELKSSATFPLGSIKGFIVGGWGQYYNTTFLEYGGGIIYSVNKFDFVLQVSNWDKATYLSPGIVYNFQL